MTPDSYGWFMAPDPSLISTAFPRLRQLSLSKLAHVQRAEGPAYDITPTVLGPRTDPNLGACKLPGKFRSSSFHGGYERGSVPNFSKSMEQ